MTQGAGRVSPVRRPALRNGARKDISGESRQDPLALDALTGALARLRGKSGAKMADDGARDFCEWTVTGMDCGSCAGKVRDAVDRLPGVSDLTVTLMSEKLKLRLDETQTTRGEIEAVVRSLGFGIATRGAPRPADRRTFVLPDMPMPAGDAAEAGSPLELPDESSDPAEDAAPWHATGKGRLVLLTGTLLAVAWGLDRLTSGSAGSWAFALACVIGLVPIARRAVAALRFGKPFTIESLMTLAAGGALVIGAAEEAALVIFLFAVGEVLERVAAGRARSGIRALGQLVPKTALVEEKGALREVRAAALRIGQRVLVRPGDRIPADGEVIEGTGGVDESPVTGESVPQLRGPGDPVFAGAINTEAALRIRVTRAAEDNTIARIIRLVEEAEEARAPTERFIDRFSRWYMPAIVAVSALVMVLPPLVSGQPWETWTYRGLALLLIGCPCALVISVPAAIAAALSSGARRGLLMKGGAVIEAAASVRAVAFDKTGTLTQGRPEVTEVVPLAAADEAEVLALAAAVETGSSHPVAQAILRRAGGLARPEARAARVQPGRGVEAEVGGRLLTVANPRHAAERGALAEEDLRRIARLEDEGRTVVVLFAERQALGLIALRDEPRPDAAEAVRQLRALGLEPTILTGDNIRAAAAIARDLGAGFTAGMLPEDKLAAIRTMTAAGGVMMVGDGINDAPALKQATVGIAMGSGTDVALETADGAILRDRVTDVPATIRLARATMGNIRQNVAIALGLKGAFLVTTVVGLTGLWPAILADTGATVLVTLNALRLLAFDPERKA